jgi:hypothetical protein
LSHSQGIALPSQNMYIALTKTCGPITVLSGERPSCGLLLLFLMAWSLRLFHSQNTPSWQYIMRLWVRFPEDGQPRPTHRCNISIRHSQTLRHSSTQTLDISQKQATSAVLILNCLLAQNGVF